MNQKKTILILSLAAICLLLSGACQWPSAAAASESNADITQTWAALSAFSQQETQEPLDGDEDSQSEETTDPTITSTPGSPMISVSVDTNCRSGPGLIYEYLGALMAYEEAEVLASSSLPGFWVIENPDHPGSECWVGEQYASIEGDTSRLPVRTPPPTATPEESAPSFGSIAGFVYHDGNNNGHFGDPQDSPWINALMILMEGDCPGGPIITTTSTDSNGGYIFSDVPAGLYCVDTNNPIFIPSDYEIDLAEGQHVVGINFRTTP